MTLYEGKRYIPKSERESSMHIDSDGDKEIDDQSTVADGNNELIETTNENKTNNKDNEKLAEELPEDNNETIAGEFHDLPLDVPKPRIQQNFFDALSSKEEDVSNENHNLSGAENEVPKEGEKTDTPMEETMFEDATEDRSISLNTKKIIPMGLVVIAAGLFLFTIPVLHGYINQPVNSLKNTTEPKSTISTPNRSKQSKTINRTDIGNKEQKNNETKTRTDLSETSDHVVDDFAKTSSDGYSDEYFDQKIYKDYVDILDSISSSNPSIFSIKLSNVSFHIQAETKELDAQTVDNNKLNDSLDQRYSLLRDLVNALENSDHSDFESHKEIYNSYVNKENQFRK